MQTKILVVEDDEILNAGLCYNLQKRDIMPYSAYCFKEAKAMIKKEAFDLILLDVNLPDGNGFDFARDVVSKCEVPFVFLTAHHLDEEIINGLQLGADDYIVKPFRIQVVIQKILTVLRRASGARASACAACGNLVIDFENRLVKKKGEPLTLTPTEYEILEVFCKNSGQILTKDVLLERIWDQKGNFVNEHTLSLNVSRLRNKLADDEYEYIKTIYGLGYKWTGGDK